jgi:hypothetical protein
MKKTLLFLIKNNKVLIIISVFAIFFIAGSIFVGKTDNRFLFTAKEKIPLSVRVFFKDNIFFIFDYKKEIKNLENVNKKLSQRSLNLEEQIIIIKKTIESLSFNPLEKSFLLTKTSETKVKSKLNQEYLVKKFNFNTKAWQYNDRKPAGYLFKYDKNIFTLTGDGVVSFFKISDINTDSIISKNIGNNLKIITKDDRLFSKSRFSFRGIMIVKDQIFISYQKQVKENCYNVAILSAALNYESLIFENFFSFDECSMNMSNHTGGKMEPFDDKSFFFTIGDAQRFSSVQDDKSLLGKLIQINYTNREYKLLAKGMRDTQGLTYYNKDKIILMTDHGPQGGDEINSLKIKEFDNYENFGWPIATYGEVPYNVIEEKKFSKHKENGFKEPLHWFKGNSVAPSQIINTDGFIKNSEKDFFMSAMGNKPAPGRRAIHHLKFDNEYSKLVYSDIINLGERVRDMIFLKDQKKILMIVENSPSIAIIENIQN